MIRHGQETVIFLVKNRGYVSESAIHDGPYNYFKNWDYAGLIGAWNAKRRPRAGPDRDNRWGTGRRDRQSTQAQAARC